MHKIAYLFIISIIILSGCSSTSPKGLSSESFIMVNLKREFVKEHAHKDQTFFVKLLDKKESQSVRSDDSDLGNLHQLTGPKGEEGLSILFYAAAGLDLIERGVKDFGGTDVLIYPEGYPDYTQNIKWGENKVIIPDALKNKEYFLCIKMSGSYNGVAVIKVNPQNRKVELVTTPSNKE